jgi:hypothetical protein
VLGGGSWPGRQSALDSLEACSRRSPFLGSVAGHPVFERAAKLAQQTLNWYTCHRGKWLYFLSLILEQESDVPYSGKSCLPCVRDEPERRHETSPTRMQVIIGH